MSALVVNFVGGPGAGKSSLCAGTFAALKWQGVNCEMALEFAKDKVWEGSLKVLEDQVYILGKQYHRIHRLTDQVDVILTDSPLILSLVYGKHMGDNFAKLALELFYKNPNLTFVVDRVKAYNPKGRIQTEDKAKKLDEKVREVLDFHEIPYFTIAGTAGSAQWIAGQVMETITNSVQ